jgi:phage-related minor tail protein
MPIGEDNKDGVKKLSGAVVKLGGDLKDVHTIADTLEGAFEDTFMAALEGASSFKDVLRSSAQTIIRELYRVLVVQRLVNAAMGFVGVTSGGANVPVGNVPGNAAGGAVYAGQPTVVGEHGREVFVPSTAGRVLSVPQSKAALGGGDGVTVNQTINISTGVQQTVRNEIKTLLPQIAETTKAAVADSKRRGGSYGRAFS